MWEIIEKALVYHLENENHIHYPKPWIQIYWKVVDLGSLRYLDIDN